MDQLRELGTAIADILPGTYKAYRPFLLSHEEDISGTPRESASYGRLERQTLDVYRPSNDNNRRPFEQGILVFVHGGGLIRQAKVLDDYANGLVYRNLGYFFANHFNMTVVIPNYRLVYKGAAFPSGGEDLSLVLDWIESNLCNTQEKVDVFLVGNSAGGVHVSTLILAPHFQAQIEKFTSDGSDARIRLQAAVFISTPFHFQQADAARMEVLTAYYSERVGEDCPLGLLSARSKQPERSPLGFLKLNALFMVAELDHVPEIVAPTREFVKLWKTIEKGQAHGAVEEATLMGHNHISPPLSLGTGLGKDEKWGFEVGSFCQASRNKVN